MKWNAKISISSKNSKKKSTFIGLADTIGQHIATFPNDAEYIEITMSGIP
jgi:hypothetical protein